MRYRLSLFLAVFLFSTAVDATSKNKASTYSFNEVWAYVMKGEEKWIQPDKAITDIAYFSLVVNETGRISSTLSKEVILKQAPPKARIHCVISAPYNRSLMYWCLSKDKETREGLIDDIVKVTSSFDGVQIDFESIRSKERDAYCAFLKDLKAKLPKNKVLSVALPARVREMNDGYAYQKIGGIVDHVLIMAYDEHWRSGAPGEIASVAWCKRVASFAKKEIPPHKLTMLIPLYGRVWQKEPVARALKYFQTLELWNKVKTLVKKKPDGIPFFEFEQKVNAVVFYEDVQSLKNKLSCYSDLSVRSVGFWRLSQEPAALWNHVKISP